MKKFSHLLLLFFLTTCIFETLSQTEASEELFPACKTDDKCGYIDKTGKRISERTYSEAHPFKNGLAFVGKKNLLSKPDVSNFGGLAFSKTNYIDKTEKVIWNGKD